MDQRPSATRPSRPPCGASRGPAPRGVSARAPFVLVAVGLLLLGILAVTGAFEATIQAAAVPVGEDNSIARPHEGSVRGAVSAGSAHSCGVQTNGTVVCWGDN